MTLECPKFAQVLDEQNGKLPILEFKWRLGASLKFSVHRKLESITRMITLLITTQFTKFKVLSLDCNHAEGFQKSEKLETLYGI